jgi:hypothetical protein
MKKVIILSLALALVGGVAYANFCARDAVPAATLLFPYVTVDMTAAGAPDVNGQTTITGITNVSSAAVIVHFTTWDALSNARIDFDEVLSGYDVLQINWRDFLGGRFDLFDTALTAFTATAPLTFDPFEWGPDGRGQPNPTTIATLANAQQRTAITTCTTVPPYGNRSDLSATIISLMSEVLVAYDHGGCGSARTLRGDKTAWAPTEGTPLFFYVTADVVNQCSLSFPNEDTYWTIPIATTSNVLVGDVIYLNAAKNYSEMFPAVHIEALSGYTGPSFYGEKVVRGFTDREPLATAFAFRYANDPLSGITSNVLLWKNQHEVGYDTADVIDDCGSYMYYAWDNDERSLSTTTQPISGLPTGGLDPNQFPLETQKVPLTQAYFDLPASYGWMLVILPPSYINSLGWVDPTIATDVTVQGDYMGWAGLQFVYGTYSAGVEAATMASYWCNSSQQLPELGANPGTTINQYGVFYPYLP